MNILSSKHIVYYAGSIASIVFIVWMSYNPTKDFTTSRPGMDSIPAIDESSIEQVNIGEHFLDFSSEESKLKGKWTQFRGPQSDNIVKDNIRLISSFASSGPKIMWSVDLGEGHAAPAIYDGKVYLLDYLENEKQDALRCFSLESGEELWRRSYDLHIKRNHGMSRTIPAVNENFLVALGPMGHVMCLDRQSGDFLWGIDLVKDYKAKIPFWYTGQCPIMIEDQVIIASGGKALLIGVDCASGNVLWETPNPDSLQMSHSSVMPMNISGKKTLVYAGIGGIIGVSAEQNDSGKILWKTNEFDPSVIAPSPVYLGNGRIFMSAGYGAGSIIFEVAGNEVKLLERYKPKEGLASEQQTPVILGKKIYGILPKDAGPLRNQFAGYSIDNLKTPILTSGKTDRFGLGPYIFADEKFFIVADDGTLTIADINGNSFNVLDKFRVIEGHDAWGPIAIADGYLLMRDSKKMLCIDIRK